MCISQILTKIARVDNEKNSWDKLTLFTLSYKI